MTRTGLAVGTLRYMSPEQIWGLEIGPPADIYALGIVLYEMLSGRAPFGGLSEYELMKAQVEHSPPSLQDLVPDLPASIAEVVMRALAKVPEERFQTAVEFLDAFGDLPPLLPFSPGQGGSAIPSRLDISPRVHSFSSSEVRLEEEPFVSLPSKKSFKRKGVTQYELLSALSESLSPSPSSSVEIPSQNRTVSSFFALGSRYVPVVSLTEVAVSKSSRRTQGAQIPKVPKRGVF